MFKTRSIAVVLAALSLAAVAQARQIIPINADWRFFRGDAADAASSSFDASAWERVDVPHDWSVAGPWDKDAPTQGGGGFLPSGVSWYRRSFTLPVSDAGKRVLARFDGIMAYSEIHLNGERVGGRPNGYIPTVCDLTEHVVFGGENILAVKTDTTLQPASRWYAGAGIYRKAELLVVDPVHVEPWGVYVTTPVADADRAVVQVRTSVVNDSDSEQTIECKTVLRGPDGAAFERDQDRPTRRTLRPGAEVTVSEFIFVDNPKRWHADAPHLYVAETKVVTADPGLDRPRGRRRGGDQQQQEPRNTTPFVSEELDRVETRFGIRDAEFRADSGFWLNGENIRLHGVCLHHDGGAVGAAVPTDIWEYRFTRLRELGVNAIRCAHNPPSQDFLDLCDRMGFLVMNEMYDCWTVGKRAAARGLNLFFEEWWEADLRDAVMRDRNHPSVILWSAGNEIHDTPREEHAKQWLAKIVAAFKVHDPDTPVTQGLFRPNVSHDFYNGLADMLDVVGTNYRDSELIEAWRNNPTRTLVGTEQRHDLETWTWARDYPQHSGQFLWTGVDYLGEAFWPNKSAEFGLLDRTGQPRARAWQRQSWWTDEPMVRIVRAISAARRPDGVDGPEDGGRQRDRLVADWTPEDPAAAGTQQVSVYSNCEQVELFLNGTSLGTQGRPESDPDEPRTWRVDFEPGTLRAVGRNGGGVTAEDELKTAGEPARLVLKPNKTELKNDFDSVAIVTAEIVDAVGGVVPNGAHRVRFEIDGPGKVIAVDNGVTAGDEPFLADERLTDQGRCIAIVRATADSGRFALTAAAEGLAPATATFQAGQKPASSPVRAAFRSANLSRDLALDSIRRDR
jgi:beta-galactosidase